MYDDENSFPEQMVCMAEDDYEKKYGIDQYIFQKGVRLTNWNNDFTFYYDKSEGYIPTDYMANNLGWFLISPKFKDVMEKLDIKNVQYLPVKIKEKITGEEIHGFNIVNIIELIDAIDWDNSEYSVFELKERGIKMISVRKYALSKNSINNLHILRLKDSKFAIFVSEQLKNELLNNGITGIDFLKVKVI